MKMEFPSAKVRPSNFLLKSKRILKSDQFFDGWLRIENGKIQDIGSGIPDPHLELFDVGNLIVMPGLIDPHVHINEPGRIEWEGFKTATHAAAAGGITSLIEMPLNSNPVTTNALHFNLKLEAAQGKLWVNCGFWGGVVPGNQGELADLIQAGVFGLKAFLTHSGIDDFPNATGSDVFQALEILKPFGLPLLVHCELELPHPDGNLLENNPQSYLNYLRSRPDQWEIEAVQLMIDLCRKTGSRVHIVHISSAGALPLVRAAKIEGLPITAETCPHYLVFNSEDIPDGDTRFKCAPPIRSRENNEKLWVALADGTLDFIASDHSPAPPEIKEIESGNLKNAWGGISGLQFSLPIIWTEAQKRGFSVFDVARWLSTAPARFTGLDTKKGKIASGYDADLVVWDPDGSVEITEDSIFHRHKITPYLNMKLAGQVHQTFINGKLAFESGSFSEFPFGEILKANRD